MVTVEAFRDEAHRDPNRGVRVQGLTLIGSGWHPTLFRAEIKALTGPIEVINPRVVYIPLTESSLDRLSRAALLDDVISNSARYWVYSEPSQEDLCRNIAEWAQNHLPEGSFAVRTRRLGVGIPGFSRSTIDREVGALVSGESRTVDLENPENIISVVISGPEDGPIHRDDVGQNSPIVVWGLSHREWQRESYSGRAPTDRPFFQPVSLDPRQARLLISLAHRRTSETNTVIDPFCGTGGIVIEAALQGIETLASDLDPRMVEGTIENLSSFGADATVEACDVSEIHSLWGDKTECAFVFDPPYGRSSWTSGKDMEPFFDALSSASRVDPEGTLSTMLPTTPEALQASPSEDVEVMGIPWSELEPLIIERGWKPVLRIPVRVHSSLARMVVVCHPAD